MSGALYPKLALSGISKNRKIYFPYILTCTGIIMIYYIIYFLSENPFLQTTHGNNEILMLMNMGRGILLIFSGIFLFYANSFLVRRRRKEFGLYNILGMGKNNIAVVMLFEALFIYIISVIAGIGFGILFSKAAELVLVNIIKADIHYEFSVNMAGIAQTAINYGLMFLLITLVSLLRVQISNPIQLLHSENTGEKPPKANWAVAIIGLLMLAGSYIFAITVNNIFAVLFGFFIAVILVIIATYLLFIAGSVVICKLLRKNKNYYYKTNHFVSVSQMAFRMKKNGAGLATICILSTMVLVTISTTVCISAGAQDTIRRMYPRDYMFELFPQNRTFASEEQISEVEEYISEALSSFDIKEENPLIYHERYLTGYPEENGIRGYRDADDSMKNTSVALYPLSDYNRILGKNETMGENEALIYYQGGYKYEDYKLFDYATLKIKGTAEKFFSNRYLSINPTVCLIVQDEFFDTLNAECLDAIDNSSDIDDENPNYSAISTVYGFDITADTDTMYEITDKLVEIILADFGTLDRLDCKIFLDDVVWTEMNYRESSGGLLFLGVVFGFIFICAAVLIMYYKQISEGYDDCSKYEILRKVGMSRKEIRQSINSQVLTVFFAPLIMAGIHLAFCFPLLKKMLNLLGLTNDNLFLGVTLICFAIFAVMYILVYILTSKIYYKIVSGAGAKERQ